MAGWKEELGLENVSPFSRPMTSGPNDVFVREDELGNKTYRTLLGQEYTIRPATPEESKTTRTRVEDWAKTGMPLPSGEQVLEAVKNIPSEAINSVDRVMKGEGTVGEAIGFVPAMSGIVPNTGRKLVSDTLPSSPEASSYTPSYDSLIAESNLMLGNPPNYIDISDLFGPASKTPEEGFEYLSSVIEEDLKNAPKNPLYAMEVQPQKEVLDALGKDRLLEIAGNLPHFEDPSYGDYLKNNIKELAKDLNLSPEALRSVIFDLAAYFPPKKNPALQTLAEAPLPEKAPLGPRANPSGKERPSDKKAEALGFNDTVYHTASGGKEFNLFDLDRTIDGGIKAPQDYLGVHVGTPRAAAERNYGVDPQIPGGAKGFTMELRARTDKPLTGEGLAKIFNLAPEDYHIGLKDGPFTENELNYMISDYEDKLFENVDPVPENSRELAAKAFRKDLAKEGYTHIPYINDVEDPGSVSYIMLIDRPKNSPAVLRDVRAEFDPKKITNPDLRFAEGGAVENVDPVSGNPVPTGSLPEEVRDDVDAKLSQGEYVLPADVVRFFGLAQIESLVSKAKEGLAQMEAKGRIGGEQEGDLPFSAEELQAVDDAPMEQAPAQPVQAPTEVRMAEGGVVLPTDANTRRTGLVVGPQSGPINGSSSLPSWMLQFGSPGGATAPTPEVTPDATKLVKENQAGQNKAGIDQGPTGMAGSVNTWSPKDFVNYAAQRNSPVNKGIETAIGMAIPLGGLLTKARQNYLEKNVPKTMEQMLETGKDLQGNVLSVTQREDLQEAYNRIATEPAKASPLSRVGEGVKYSLGIGSSPANYTSRTASGGQSDKTATLSTNRPNQKPAITATKAPSTLTRSSSAAPSRSTSTSNQPKVSGGKPGLARGGLITKRNK